MRHLGDPISRRIARPLGWYLPGGDYSDRVLGYNPIAYWPLNETAGATAVCLVNSAQNAAYTGVTLGQTVTDANGVVFVCPLFDGANDYVNVYTATFSSAFNGAEGTSMVWARMFNAGVWTDGSTHQALHLEVNGQNNLFMIKRSNNNQFRWQKESGNVTDRVDKLAITETDWMCIAMTWSESADELIAYYNGSQEGATQGTLGVWAAGALSATANCIGAASTVPAGAWYGWLAHCAIWDTPLTAPQIADLATV